MNNYILIKGWMDGLKVRETVTVLSVQLCRARLWVVVERT